MPRRCTVCDHPERHSIDETLELPPIGWQLFILDSSQSDSIAFPSCLDTYATYLLTEPLSLDWFCGETSFQRRERKDGHGHDGSTRNGLPPCHGARPAATPLRSSSQVAGRGFGPPAAGRSGGDPGRS